MNMAVAVDVDVAVAMSVATSVGEVLFALFRYSSRS